MSIAVPVNSAARARQLKAKHPYLTPRDIAENTGIPLKNVTAALKAKPADKPKTSCGHDEPAMADALDAQTVGQYQLPVVGFLCARCNRNADVDIALVRKRFGAGVTLLEAARQLAADGGRCALAAEGFNNICGARPYEPDVTVWATLSHAKFGGWGARLRCRRHMAALKVVKPCPEVIDLDPVQLIASHGHDMRLDRLPAKLICPGCGTALISIEWIVPNASPPAGGQAAAPVLQLRPGRAAIGRKKFRVIGGGQA